MTGLSAAQNLKDTSPAKRNVSDRFGIFIFWLLILILAWAPIPMGSNRGWSWSLLSLLVVIDWLLLAVVVWIKPRLYLDYVKEVKWPLIFLVIAIAWALIQVCPWVPQSWAHPVWQLAADVLSIPLSGKISIDPWSTLTSVMKFVTYIMVFCVVYFLSRATERAHQLLAALVIIGMFYGIYTLVFTAFNWTQFSLFYSGPYSFGNSAISAPFLNPNSYATFGGLMALCAGTLFASRGAQSVVASRGWRPLVMSGLNYVFGRGIWALAAFLLLFSTVIAGGSRAGFIAIMAGLATLLALSIRVAAQSGAARWAFAATLVFALGIGGLVSLYGDTLVGKLDALVQAGGRDETRLLLWAAAERMIAAAPFLGLGLGTYEVAYPMYAEKMIPLIMDRAHNDYLELAAGLGLPAAILWWGALIWLTGICVRGVFIRRRNRGYPMLAVGASVLVGVHSAFDFSLQIPAIAVTYAAILGLGVAQSFSTRQA